MARKGYGKGRGQGYKNLQIRDPLIHGLSAKGVKTKGYCPVCKKRTVRKDLGGICENSPYYYNFSPPKIKKLSAEGKLKTIGKYSMKKYQCTRCGRIEMQGTNHWGEIYPSCQGCSWKNPMSPQSTWVCLEPMPKGYEAPPKWKTVKLGDIADIYDSKGKKLNAKGDWKAIGDGDVFVSKDGNKMLEIETRQDRDGKNAFLHTVKLYPHRLALNPKYARKSITLSKVRDYKKARKKTKAFMNLYAKIDAPE